MALTNCMLSDGFKAIPAVTLTGRLDLRFSDSIEACEGLKIWRPIAT